MGQTIKSKDSFFHYLYWMGTENVKQVMWLVKYVENEKLNAMEKNPAWIVQKERWNVYTLQLRKEAHQVSDILK
jgi:hypothetical protein